MWAVVGLGNPGSRYARTRHNLGFMVADVLTARGAARFATSPAFEWARIVFGDAPVLIVKPRTYVNRSGGAVRALLEQHALQPAQLLVVVDDVYLPFGRLRLRPSGSAGGHNGLRSIEEALATTDYARLRIGVGAPGAADLAEHVLGSFSAAEAEAVPGLVERAADAVQRVLELGVEGARPVINAPPDGD